jgi:hypothetical protein
MKVSVQCRAVVTFPVIERSPGILWVRAYADPRAILDITVKRKVPAHDHN